jgi:CheY-like chemotaxis protein
LLQNALKFTQTGDIRLEVDYSEAKGAFIQVIDTGIGIPENLFERVFDDYFQAPNGKIFNRQEGLGLGLTIVKKICGLLKIGIGISKSNDCGLKFSLSIDSNHVKAAEELAELQFGAAIDLTGLNVLCIDDDEDITAALTLVLNDWRCVSHAFTSIADAKKWLSEKENMQSLDVVLCDYSFENSQSPMNGLTFLYELRTEMSAVSAAIITGDLDFYQNLQLQDFEFPVLLKPVSEIELRKLLEVFRGLEDAS